MVESESTALPFGDSPIKRPLQYTTVLHFGQDFFMPQWYFFILFCTCQRLRTFKVCGFFSILAQTAL